MFVIKTILISEQITLHKKMKFSIKDFFSKYDQIQFPADLVTFTEEIRNGKFYFLYSVSTNP